MPRFLVHKAANSLCDYICVFTAVTVSGLPLHKSLKEEHVLLNKYHINTSTAIFASEQLQN